MIEIIKINNNKFKSIYFSYNFTLKLRKEEIASTVISCFTLSKGTKKYETAKKMEKYLSSLYGSAFDFNVEKIGDLFNFEFKIECVNKKYLPNNEDILIKCIQFLNEVIYNPKIGNGLFNTLIYEREKENVISNIEKRKDEKLKYGVQRAEEIMLKDTVSGNFIFGNLDDAKRCTNEIAVEAYKNMLENSYRSIIVSGNLDGYDDIDSNINEIFNIDQNAINNNEIFNYLNVKNVYKENIEEVKEQMDTVQSVLCVGMKNLKEKDEDFFVANIYNAILGGSPSSKLFQNVREKESLAYTTRSRYYRFKKIYVIYAGIEEKNYEKAKNVIFKQLEDMRSGNITETEMKAAKESLISDVKEWNDTKVALAKLKYMNLVSGAQLTIDKMIEEFNKITIDDVKKYASNVEIKLVYLLGGGKNE